MKKRTKKDSEFEIKFWKDWLEADTLKKMEMVEKLPIVNEISDIAKIPPKIRKHTFALMLNGFFEDLESAVYTKVRLDKQTNKR